MHIRRERGVNARRRDGFFPQPGRLFEDAGQIVLDLQRGEEPLGEEIEGGGGDNVAGGHGRGTLLQEPQDRAALLPLDAFQLQDCRACADLFPRGPAPLVFEPGRAGENDRQARAPMARLFDKLLEAPQGLAMEVMAVIDKQRNGFLAALHHFDALLTRF